MENLFMEVTYGQIKSSYPILWDQLLEKGVVTEFDPEKKISIMDIVNSLGVPKALGVLRCVPFKDSCLFLCDMVDIAAPAIREDLSDKNKYFNAVEIIREQCRLNQDVDENLKPILFQAIKDYAAYYVINRKKKDIKNLFIKYYAEVVL